MRSDVHNISSQETYGNTYYNARGNTIYIIPGKTPSPVESNETKELNEKRDIETRFLFDLDIFNSVYHGDLSVLDTFPEMTELLKVRDHFLNIQKETSSERDLKIVNQELLKISKRITEMKESLSIKYIENVVKKIGEILPSYEEKIRYVGQINSENPNLTNFVALFHATMSNKTDNPVRESLYKNTEYLPFAALNTFLMDGYRFKESAYTQEQKNFYKNRFMKLNDVDKVVRLSKFIDESNVFSYLADINNDGKVSDNDIGVFYGKQLSVLLNETEIQMAAVGKETDFYKNLSYVFQFG